MKHYASCSFGKDSIATIILAHEHNEPLDTIVYVRVMFDKSQNISGEHPLHEQFIHEVAIPTFKSWGYEVVVLEDKQDYKDHFYHVIQKSEANKGKINGYLIPRHCLMNDRGKLRPIKAFYKGVEKPYVQYVGIAIDEPVRLARMHEKDNTISLLEKYEVTEEQAYELCQQHGLLSPVYQITKRNGCWFCPNAKDHEMKNIRDNYPELWNELLEMDKAENKATTKFNYKDTIEELEQRFKLQDSQLNIFEFLESEE